VCVCFCVSGNISTKLCGTKSSEHTHADHSNYAHLLGVVRECCTRMLHTCYVRCVGVCGERVSGISWTKPGVKKSSEH
jgi:hypothetical protein